MRPAATRERTTSVLSQSLPSVAANDRKRQDLTGERLTSYMTDFKGVHYPKSVILYAVFFYVR
jgi:hypothetical protein